MEREYIWAAHDTAGVNELHVAIDWFDREAWPIQDPHNQSVYGYTDPVGELVEQRIYAPFGQILNADKTPLAKPSGLYFDFRLRVGMHGMFAERLDASTTDPLLRHADARVVYLTPNRTYDPKTGLWWQRDPNATGLLVLDRMYADALPFEAGVGNQDITAHYRDGLNLTQAFGSSPATYADTTGLLLEVPLLAQGPTRMEIATRQLAAGMAIIGMTEELIQVINGQQSALEFASGVALGIAGGKLFDMALDQFRFMYTYLKATRSSGITLNRAFGISAEEFVRSAVGGVQKRFTTSQGTRVMDSVTGSLGIEVKTGTQSATTAIKSQVAKDAELLSTRQLDTIEWHFYDGRTGNPGRPSGPLRQLLEKAGIVVKELGPAPVP